MAALLGRARLERAAAGGAAGQLDLRIGAIGVKRHLVRAFFGRVQGAT